MIKGFEEDVGTKTSFYGFTVNTMKNSLISYKKLGFTSVPQGQVGPLTGELFPEPLRGGEGGGRVEPQGSQAWVQWVQSCARILGAGVEALRRENSLGGDAPLFQAAPHHSAPQCEWLMFTEGLWGATAAPLSWRGGQGPVPRAQQSSSRAGVQVHTPTPGTHTREGVCQGLRLFPAFPFPQSCLFLDGSVSKATTRLESIKAGPLRPQTCGSLQLPRGPPNSGVCLPTSPSSLCRKPRPRG